jgi:hypothetical protein
MPVLDEFLLSKPPDQPSEIVRNRFKEEFASDDAIIVFELNSLQRIVHEEPSSHIDADDSPPDSFEWKRLKLTPSNLAPALARALPSSVWL